MTKIGSKPKMNPEYFHHKVRTADRRRAANAILLEQELWLEQDNWKPVKVVFAKRKRKSLWSLLTEIRP